MAQTPCSVSSGARRWPRVRRGAVLGGIALVIAAYLMLGLLDVAHAFPWSRPALEPARTGSGTSAAVYALIAACVGVLIALVGGAAGSAGLRGGRRLLSRDRLRQDELLHERDHEAREQDAAGRGLKRR